jgi:hypothetical protein
MPSLTDVETSARIAISKNDYNEAIRCYQYASRYYGTRNMVKYKFQIACLRRKIEGPESALCDYVELFLHVERLVQKNKNHPTIGTLARKAYDELKIELADLKTKTSDKFLQDTISSVITLIP